jgi:ADP-ribose pyrophosphatase YjhB (NUDIX family)
MLIIFSLNQQFILTAKKNTEIPDNTIRIEISKQRDIDSVIKKIIAEKTNKNYCIYYKKIEVLFNHFASFFKLIEAAGGLVKNRKGEYLFIFRNGKWDLPKGKLEKKETIENAAIREVEEECGISNLSIVKKLSPTYHIYQMEEKNILKCSYWFEMTYTGKEKLIPQYEEGITEVEWIKPTNLGKILGNTFPSILEILKTI